MSHLKENLPFGTEYRYVQYLSPYQVWNIIHNHNPDNNEYVIAVLMVGTLRIDAVLYSGLKAFEPYYDIYVKSGAGNSEWIYYDSLQDVVRCEVLNFEDEMASFLEWYRQSVGLSYTECNFTVEFRKRKTLFHKGEREVLP